MSWPSAPELQCRLHPQESYHLLRPVDPVQSLPLARTHLRHELDVSPCLADLPPAPAMHQQELGEEDDIKHLQRSPLAPYINPL